MGIYVFKKQVLCKLLNDVYPNDNDFGGEIIPKAAKDYKVGKKGPIHVVVHALE